MKRDVSSGRRLLSLGLLSGLLVIGLSVGGCSPDYETGLWIQVTSPTIPIDRVRADVFDASSAEPTLLETGELALPEARTFDALSHEPENQLWILIYTDPQVTQRVRIYGVGFRGNREVAYGVVESAQFFPGKIASHDEPLELSHSGEDKDLDGFYTPDDCDDHSPAVYPRATEVCNGLDDNCDSTNDEGCSCIAGEQRECWPHWANPLGCEATSSSCPCRVGIQLCESSQWGSCDGLVTPGSEGSQLPCLDGTYNCQPTCSDGIDNNCDGFNDQRDRFCGGCTPDTSKPCYTGRPETENVGLCRSGRKWCLDGSYGPCEDQVLPAGEICDGFDNNCDGATDNFKPEEKPFCEPNEGVCAGYKKTCVWMDSERKYTWVNCTGTEFQQHARELLCGGLDPLPDCCPDRCYQLTEAVQFCDGLDNDCDGLTDNVEEDCRLNHPQGHAQVIGCTPGSCLWECDPNWWDISPVDLGVEGGNGCEYFCVRTDPPLEQCDGLDNDCNGKTDGADSVPISTLCPDRGNASATKCVSPQYCDFTCLSNWDDCDGDLNQPIPLPGDPATSNGCESDLTSDELHCGSCNHPCQFSHGRAECQSSVCRLTGCDTGYGNCDGQEATGCETAISSDLDHCGNCNNPCRRDHATERCIVGVCRIDQCDPLWGTCDGNETNGCETPLNTLADCGGCTVPCSRANATASCQSGNCQIGTCTNPYQNCDLIDSNGCETNTLNDANHCGGCNSSCGNNAYCSSGGCACNPVFGNCDNVWGNGCETALGTDATCASCLDACVSGYYCNTLACVSCTANDHCGSSCTNCSSGTTDKVCIDDAGAYRCGCNTVSDCVAGQCCILATHSCGAGTFDTACGSSCTDCTQTNNHICINDSGTYRCGCGTDADCASGYYCGSISHSCNACTVNWACGTSCTNCMAQSDNQVCVNDAGTYRCGCTDGWDCDTPSLNCNTGTHYCE